MAADKYAPWTDAPPCPKCAANAVTPFHAEMQAGGFSRAQLAGSADSPSREAMLNCAACGEVWFEQDSIVVAWAWWSAGANETRQALEAEFPRAAEAGR